MKIVEKKRDKYLEQETGLKEHHQIVATFDIDVDQRCQDFELFFVWNKERNTLIEVGNFNGYQDSDELTSSVEWVYSLTKAHLIAIYKSRYYGACQALIKHDYSASECEKLMEEKLIITIFTD